MILIMHPKKKVFFESTLFTQPIPSKEWVPIVHKVPYYCIKAQRQIFSKKDLHTFHYPGFKEIPNPFPQYQPK